MRRFLDIIGSCLLIIIAVFAIYLCVYLGFELSSSVNGENIQQEQPEEPHEHIFGEWQVVTVATCTEEGKEQRLCECGEAETRTIAATGHNYTETIVAPTCTEQGYTLHTCTNCEHTYTDNEIAALGHEFGEWQVITAATCAEEGQEQRLCECGETETRTIAATAHSFTIISEEGNECIGITRHLQCEICGEEETFSILGIGHTFDQITIGGSNAERIPATCTSPAFDKETCSRCGEVQLTKVEGSSALGHEFGEWEIDVDPTYTQEGSKHRTCTRCDAEETEAISKLDVVIEIEENLLIIPEINPSEGTITLYYTEVGSDVTASYVIGNVTSFDLTTLLTIEYMPMEAGKTYELKIMYDSGAGDYIYSNVITYESPVNYEYDGYWLYDIEGAGTWVIRMTETTFELAEAIKVDSKYETTTDYELFNLNANTLDGNHLNLYVNPDDTSEVYLYYDITTNLLVYGGMAASRINEEDVSVHTHTYGEWQVVTAATCTEEGREQRLCECGETETRTIAATGHNYVDGVCSNCGARDVSIEPPIEELSFKGYWYLDDGDIQWFNIKDEEVESGIGFLEDNKLLITPAIVVCPIISITEDEDTIMISFIVEGETFIEDYLVFDKNENSLTTSEGMIYIRANEVGEY